MENATPQLVLSGMKVVSFTHWLQGPAATQYLADMGADVIKVEAPGGSHERRWNAAGRDVGGYGTLHLSANRNVRSIVLNLKHEEGISVAKKLIEQSEVLIENYRPGVMERLGLGYDEVKTLNEEIIYASATGYGPDGPLSKGPGQDLLVQARAGMVAQNGEFGVRPTPIGNSGIDQHGAALLALGIVGAYVKRLATGKGTRVEGSLYTACTDFMQEGLVHYFSGGHDKSVLKRDSNLCCWYIEAPYGAYLLEDASIVVSMNSYELLYKSLEDSRIEKLIYLDPWEHRDQCAEVLAEVLQELTFEEVKRRFDAHGIWFEKVQSFDDMRDDPQAEYAQIFHELPVGNEKATLINHPIRYDGEVPPVRMMPFEAGSSTRSILEEAGYNEEEIGQLISCNAVGVNESE